LLVGPVVCGCSRMDELWLVMADVTSCESRVTHCLHLHAKVSEDQLSSLASTPCLLFEKSELLLLRRVKCTSLRSRPSTSGTPTFSTTKRGSHGLDVRIKAQFNLLYIMRNQQTPKVHAPSVLGEFTKTQNHHSSRNSEVPHSLTQ